MLFLYRTYVIWFKQVEKPLIIGITENNQNASDMVKFHPFDDYIKPAMKAYFDVRESQWPNGDFNEVAIPWMSWQNPQWDHKGSVAVPVSQHSRAAEYITMLLKRLNPTGQRGPNFKQCGTMFLITNEYRLPIAVYRLSSGKNIWFVVNSEKKPVELDIKINEHF